MALNSSPEACAPAPATPRSSSSILPTLGGEPLTSARERAAAPGPSEQAGHSEHVVQFYESEQFLLDSVQRFVAAGLRSGQAAIVAATRPHLDELERRWMEDGLDLADARERAQYVPLEATETLSRLCVNGSPDAEQFERIIGATVAAAAARHPAGIVAFGELVALLTREGRHTEAMKLEDLWNGLAEKHQFALLCGYPLADFVSESGRRPFHRICHQHTRLVPAESYSGAGDEAERLGKVLSLQRKALALEQEIADREHAEDALRAAERRRDEFLATLAHELRNPLAPMRNAVEIMRLANRDYDTITTARGLVERQLDYLVRLVDDLLDVSRITRGRVELRTTLVDLRSITQLALEITEPLLAEKRQRLRVEQPGEPLLVQGDATRLAQVLSNLLNNSVAHSEPGSVITIRLSREEHQAVMQVADRGAGIAPELLPRVFEMFAVPTLASEGAPGGVGIGLTLVKYLVELHGGTVQARSDGLNTGSTFTVRLPLADTRGSGANDCSSVHRSPSADSSADGSASRSPGGDGSGPRDTPDAREAFDTEVDLPAPKRILVADDNRDAAASLAMILELDGHTVRTAYDGAEALLIAAEFEPDVLLLDIGMPRLDGYEAARLARAQPWGRRAKVVALTGWGLPEDRRRTQEAGFDHHLLKPCTPEALRAALGDIPAGTDDPPA